LRKLKKALIIRNEESRCTRIIDKTKPEGRKRNPFPLLLSGRAGTGGCCQEGDYREKQQLLTIKRRELKRQHPEISRLKHLFKGLGRKER